MRRDAVVLLLVCFLATLAGAQTGYIRQFAKDRPRVAFIAIGPDSKMLAYRLRDRVLDHGENVHKRNEVTVVMADQVMEWMSQLGSTEHASLIFLIAGKELKQPLPSDVAVLMPKGHNPLAGQVSFVQSQMLKPAKQGLAFSVLLYAPDGTRLGWLGNEFVSRAFGNWREMPYATEFWSEQIALFGADHMKPVAEWWGNTGNSQVWRHLTWHPMERRDLLLPEELEHRAEVYLVDRSKPSRLPPEAGGLLTGAGLTETSMYVGQEVGADGRKKIVFSAPSSLLLQNLARRFPSLSKLPEASYRVEAVDLRSLDKALLVVPSGNVDNYAAEHIHAQLLRQLEAGTGQPLHPPLSEGPPNEVPISWLLGRSEDSVAFKQAKNLRYAWVYTLEAPNPSMSYNTYETRHTADPGSFSESEPCEPDRKRKTEEEYKKAYKKYREEHEEWCERKRDWEYRRENMDVHWSRVLQRDTTVRIAGHLRLLDLADGARTVWEAKVEGSASEYSRMIHQDAVVVRGFDHVPGALSRPDSDGLPPVALIIEASVGAAQHGINRLQAEAWLPEFRVVAGSAEKR